MRRAKLTILWALCALVAPLLLLAMLVMIARGTTGRALSMEIAFDECGNAMTGGAPTETISSRTGKAAAAGKRWGLIAAPIIDFFFGAGHCAAQAGVNG